MNWKGCESEGSLPNLDSIQEGLRKTKKCWGQCLQFLYRNISRNKGSGPFDADIRWSCIDMFDRAQNYRSL